MRIRISLLLFHHIAHPLSYVIHSCDGGSVSLGDRGWGFCVPVLVSLLALVVLRRVL